MPRKEKSIHYLYKTTCKVTGRYYIGMHSTSNLKDGYLGSGKRLRYSIRKHGKDNHEKEILEFFDSRELLVEAEKLAIIPEMLVDTMCMNLMGGGSGGFISETHYNNLKRISSENRLKLLKNTEFKEKIILDLRRGVIKAHKNGVYKENYINWTDKKHSEKTKKLMSESSKGIGSGVNNSQYGTCWITNGTENKKIKKDDLNFWVNNNWKLGRTSTNNQLVSKETINRIKNLYFQLKSTVKVAKELKIAKSTVQKYLKT